MKDDLGVISHATTATYTKEHLLHDRAMKLQAQSLKEVGALAKARFVFDLFDHRNQGEIQPEDFHKLAEALGKEYTELQVERELQKLDTNHDGLIQYSEFERW